MKTTLKIAKAELQNLFYSPVAWFILIVFVFQCGMVVAGIYERFARSQALGYELYDTTLDFFAHRGAFFYVVQQYLYLYVPLLTMGLMSREFGSGSIKLYYSSPITNRQIVLGKYFAMMVYSLILMSVLAIYILIGFFAFDHFDLPVALSGLLGIYLLVCTYVAIGLFMSSLTSYQVVAAIGTLVVLGILNYIGMVWQNIAFVRDLTYWLSISGRSSEFINGLICSEDVLYFIIVTALFLLLTIFHLQASRQRSSFSVVWGKYVGIIVSAVMLGYITSRPVARCFYDATRMKVNTLTPASQEIVRSVKGGLTITTYSNILDKYGYLTLPERINNDLRRFREFLRFKPEIKMKYVYYYDTATDPSLEQRFPNMTNRERAQKLAVIYNFDFKKLLSPQEIRERIDLSEEANRFVRVVERASGEKTFLRVFDDPDVFPSEAEISVAFRRLVEPSPTFGFLHGHGERDNHALGERDYGVFALYKPFRYSLINQGVDFVDVTLEQEISSDVHLIIIADMRSTLTPRESENLDKYIARGGNLIIFGDVNRQEQMNTLVQRFGVEFMPGILVNKIVGSLPNQLMAKVSPEAKELAYAFYQMITWKTRLTLNGCVGINCFEDKGFDVTPLLVTDSTGSWNEMETTNFVDDTVRLNPVAGEIERSYVAALALSRDMNGKKQRIIITGDADWLSNSAVNEFANYSFLTGICSWVTDNKIPLNTRRPEAIDNRMFLSQDQVQWLKLALVWGLPFVLLLTALLMWFRRRGR